MKYIAFYGTLMEGMPRWDQVEQFVTFVEELGVGGTLYDVNGQFPAWNLEEPGGTVLEVYEYEDAHEEELLEICDAIEGHPHLFQRITLQLVLNIGDMDEDLIDCWVYKGRAPYLFQGNKVKYGSWRAHQKGLGV